MRHSKKSVRHWVFVCALAAIVSALFVRAECANADLIYIQSYPPGSTQNLGTFEGTIEYGFDIDADAWTVLVTLTNTSPEGNGGYITGFIFNIDSQDPDASATLLTATHPFENAPGQSGQPLGGTYDAGAVLGGSFQGGGGNPAQGIGVGDTGSFLFTVSASDANSLSAASFINGPEEFDFLVRFRGFNSGGSDKVPAEEYPGPPVPGPTALMVLAVGLMCFKRRGQSM